MMFNHPQKDWLLGLLYDIPAVPEHLKIFLENNDRIPVQKLVRWLHAHNVRGVAYCTGGWFARLKCRRFVRQFNTGMEQNGMLADLGEFYAVVMAAEEKIKREAKQ